MISKTSRNSPCKYFKDYVLLPSGSGRTKFIKLKTKEKDWPEEKGKNIPTVYP